MLTQLWIFEVVFAFMLCYVAMYALKSIKLHEISLLKLRRHSCLYKSSLICTWRHYSRQVCTSELWHSSLVQTTWINANQKSEANPNCTYRTYSQQLLYPSSTTKIWFFMFGHMEQMHRDVFFLFIGWLAILKQTF